jgi:hypothetical protein
MSVRVARHTDADSRLSGQSKYLVSARYRPHSVSAVLFNGSVALCSSYPPFNERLDACAMSPVVMAAVVSLSTLSCDNSFLL